MKEKDEAIYIHTNNKNVIETKETIDDFGNEITLYNYLASDTNNKIDIKKSPLTEVNKLYHHHYDFGAKATKHRHYLFTNVEGAREDSVHGSGDAANDPMWLAYTLFHHNGAYRWQYKKKYANEKEILKQGDYGKAFLGALRDNFRNPNTENGKDWMDYCLKHNKLTFHDFSPIPNIGLYLWNNEIFNTEATTSLKGTTAEIENGTSGFYYYDINGKIYSFDNKSNFLINSSAKGDEYKVQKFKRRQQAIKLDEFESRLPISYKGHAKYALKSLHVVYRDSHGGTDNEESSLTYKGICGYELSSFNVHDDFESNGLTVYNEEDNTLKYSYHYDLAKKGNIVKVPITGWSCVTSLPYSNTEYLAFGDWADINSSSLDSSTFKHLKNTDPTSYYINHNVTDTWRDYFKKYEDTNSCTVKMGDNEISIDTQAPYPSHVYLLPLIRL